MCKVRRYITSQNKMGNLLLTKSYKSLKHKISLISPL